MTPLDLLGRKVRVGRGKKTWIVDEWDRGRGLLHLTVDDPAAGQYAASTTIPAREISRLHLVDEEVQR